MVKEGTFRKDLYYRLVGVTIYLPPLRDRREDIAPLVDFYLEKYCREHNRQVELSEEVKKKLSRSHRGSL